MIRHRRTVSAVALTVGALLVGALGLATPASAHVTVNPREATQGGYGRLAFRVPNESDTASTIKLEVTLPEDAPVASVSIMPVPGWKVETEKRKLDTPLESHGSQITEAVSKITWTAEKGNGIQPGQFQEFPVSMGPLPKVDRMVFKALQTYSDGKIARWIEEPPVDGGEEPDTPAPVLKLTAATETAASPAPDTQAAASSSDDEGGNGAALGLGIAGLIAGLAGLVLGGLAFARTRKAAA